MTDEQMRLAVEFAESALTDLADYRTAQGTPTYDDRRVGRMLAREPVIARALLAASTRLAAVEQVVQSSKTLRAAETTTLPGESIAELEKASRTREARTQQALTRWRIAVDALDALDAHGGGT